MRLLTYAKAAKLPRHHPTEKYLSMTLAIFDLDNTLLAGDSDHLWGQYLVDRQIVNGELYERENERFYREYREGTLDIHEFLAFSLKPLADHSLQDLYRWRDEFVETLVRPIVLPQALELVEGHRQQGHTLMIITATNRFVTEPIARLFSIQNLLATEPEMNSHGYTGQVAGTPCFKEGKVTRLQITDGQARLRRTTEAWRGAGSTVTLITIYRYWIWLKILWPWIRMNNYRFMLPTRAGQSCH